VEQPVDFRLGYAVMAASGLNAFQFALVDPLLDGRIADSQDLRGITRCVELRHRRRSLLRKHSEVLNEGAIPIESQEESNEISFSVQRFRSAVYQPRLSAQSLQVVDAEGHSNTLSAAQFAERPRVTINVREHDTPVQFEGGPLATLLSSIGIQLGDKLRGPRLTEALLVEASDGYKVVFALAEFDKAFATREIILADKRTARP